MENKILRVISLFLCTVLLLCFAGCGNAQDAASSENSGSASGEVSNVASGEVSSKLSSTASITGGGAKPRLDSAFADYDGIYPKIEWSNLAGRNNWTAKVVIKDLSGKTVFEESGITTNSYTLKRQLNNNQEYRLFVYYSNSDGSVSGLMGGIDSDGMKIIYQKRAESQSKYYFDGSIGLDTLNNYLNRSMVFCQFFQPEEDFNIVIDSIIGAGAKYVQRAACIWAPGTWEYSIKNTIKDRVDKIHAQDSQVILEACIFECINGKVEEISIPAEVFKAFGLTPENRTFDLEKMIFTDGRYKNKWGTGTYVPDITRIETQMFFYHRATYFIDLGFEALHLGQTNLIGNSDTNNVCWTKVINKIRAYAKENARRHYVIINGHNPSQNFKGTDGKMLVDFNAFPMRISVAAGQKDHKATEKNPQLCVITPGQGDAVYKKNIKGTSPSGWTTDKYPYLVEIDNWGIQSAGLDKANSSIWGYDEITWFAVQPQWYRQKFIEDLTKQIDSFNENGHFSVPGKRWISVVPNGTGSNTYFAASGTGVNYYGDLEFYKDMWNRLKK